MNVPVLEQYARYPYPEPGDDIPTWLQTYNYDPYDPKLYSALFWPEGRPRGNLKILVAGCGSMQAAVLAFSNPESIVLGVDFSPESIAHEERLKERHRLTNLELHRMDLLAVSELGHSFDLIVCTGVLHHMTDPAQGLRSLSSVLEPTHGAMVLMLYGRLGRGGIYPLQDAFRRMRITQTPEGVRRVRSIIEQLPAHHPGRRYFERSPEMKSDAAIVDTFLHPQDRAFRVQDVLDLVEGNGLRFQGWLDSAKYNSGSDNQSWESLDPTIPDRDRWSIVESLTASIPTHHFLACRPERDKRSQITFDGDQWLAYYPVRHPTSRAAIWENGKYARDGYEFSLIGAEAALFAEANGRRSVADLLRHPALSKTAKNERIILARSFYARMWRLGHMFFSASPIRAVSPDR
jgi:SAM-dependent methyltransferase